MIICGNFLQSELENLIGKVMLLVQFCTFWHSSVLILNDLRGYFAFLIVSSNEERARL